MAKPVRKRLKLELRNYRTNRTSKVHKQRQIGVILHLTYTMIRQLAIGGAFGWNLDHSLVQICGTTGKDAILTRSYLEMGKLEHERDSQACIVQSFETRHKSVFQPS